MKMILYVMAEVCGKTVIGTKQHDCVGRYIMSFRFGNRVVLKEKNNEDSQNQDASVEGAIRSGVDVCMDCPARRLAEASAN